MKRLLIERCTELSGWLNWLSAMRSSGINHLVINRLTALLKETVCCCSALLVVSIEPTGLLRLSKSLLLTLYSKSII